MLRKNIANLNYHNNWGSIAALATSLFIRKPATLLLPMTNIVLYLRNITTFFLQPETLILHFGAA